LVDTDARFFELATVIERLISMYLPLNLLGLSRRTAEVVVSDVLGRMAAHMKRFKTEKQKSKIDGLKAPYGRFSYLSGS